MFYMNMGVLNEGEQAEAYKARKMKEELYPTDKNRDRKRQLRIGVYDGDYYTFVPNPEKYVKGKGWIYKAEENGVDREKARQYAEKRKDNAIKATSIAAEEAERRKKEKNNNNTYSVGNYDITMDAVAKHLRRHPEKLKEDCGIFESVEII